MNEVVLFVLLGVAVAACILAIIDRNRALAECTLLQARIEALEIETAMWRGLAGPMWVGDESEGHFVCLACNQPGAEDGGCKTIQHLPDCEYAAALAAEEER
jgi:hypothetical protein